MIVILFSLECHRKTTFAAGFWVLCALVICTPPRLIQLVLGCGELWKVTPTVSSHLYTSLEEDRGRCVTIQTSSSARIQWHRGGVQRPLWTRNKKIKVKKKLWPVKWAVETVHQTAFHLHPFICLLSRSLTAHDFKRRGMFYSRV